MTAIRCATADDLESLYKISLEEPSNKEEGYFERCLDEQKAGKRDVFVICDDTDVQGYCHYQRFPGYQPFRSMGIPEIQDLYVRPAARRNGLAARMIEYCIQQARNEGHDLIGIGVGLCSNYGKAQRLYVKMGFEPDGGGIVYDRKAVMQGQMVRADDELCLMMIKRID